MDRAHTIRLFLLCGTNPPAAKRGLLPHRLGGGKIRKAVERALPPGTVNSTRSRVQPKLYRLARSRCLISVYQELRSETRFDRDVGMNNNSSSPSTCSTAMLEVDWSFVYQRDIPRRLPTRFVRISCCSGFGPRTAA